jgi:thiamine-monophosphate kinase
MAGLALLERGHRIDADSNSTKPRALESVEAIRRHLAPDPHLALGRAIGERGLATAMIDVSDGLSTDLAHLAEESCVGAVLHADAVPVAEIARKVAGHLEQEPLLLALHGGEEYELLFTVSPDSCPGIVALSGEFRLPITAIGEMVDGSGLWLERHEALEVLQPSGYEHRL